MLKTNSQSGKAFIWVLVLIIIAIILYIIFGGNRTTPAASYTVTINNISDSQPLSPGVYALHTSEASFDFEGVNSPAELEPLAEYGSHTAFAEYVETLPGIAQLISVDSPLPPGASGSFRINVPKGEYYLSGIQMAVASNDGYALLNAERLNNTNIGVFATNYDNGTEENEPLGSGFAGGQPDPSRGEANVENGEESIQQVPVTLHDQLTQPIMEINITVNTTQ